MGDFNQLFAGKAEHEILDMIARELRKKLNTTIEYGYDGNQHSFFFNAREYGTFVDIHAKYLRDRRWDILLRTVEVFEGQVEAKRGESIENRK